jgi:transposase-like protein
MGKRHSWTAEEKTAIVTAIVSGLKTRSQSSQENGIPYSTITLWHTKFLKMGAEAFTTSNKKRGRRSRRETIAALEEIFLTSGIDPKVLVRAHRQILERARPYQAGPDDPSAPD